MDPVRPFYLVAGALLFLAAPAVAELPAVGIGIVQDGASLDAEIGDPIVREIRALLEGERGVTFQRESGEWTTESVRAAVEKLLADDEVDLVVAVGAISSQLFCCYKDLPKPVVATVVLDAGRRRRARRRSACLCRRATRRAGASLCGARSRSLRAARAGPSGSRPRRP